MPAEPDNSDDDDFSVSFGDYSRAIDNITAFSFAAIAFIAFGAVLLILHITDASLDPNKIFVALLPALLFLLFSGRISGFKAFGIEIKSEIEKLSKQPIGASVSFTATDPIPCENIDVAPKGDTALITKYIHDKIPALGFELGRTGYYRGDVLRDYVENLSARGVLRWVVFHNQDGKFSALVPVEKVRAYGNSESDQVYWNNLVEMIEQNDLDDLPGVISSRMALSIKDTKARALNRFSKTDADDLPVINDERKFVGVVNRVKLNSLVLSRILGAAARNQ